jgi:hypothetical protein
MNPVAAVSQEITIDYSSSIAPMFTSAFRIYPNPTNGTFRLENGSTRSRSIQCLCHQWNEGSGVGAERALPTQLLISVHFPMACTPFR